MKNKSGLEELKAETIERLKELSTINRTTEYFKRRQIGK